MIMCGLVLGQYFSQYDIREISSGYSATNSPQVDGELLLGYNDAYAAEQLRFNFTQWDHSTRDTKSFLLWLKQEVMLGHLVTIGVYTNEYLFYCKTNSHAGDSDYDHIVSVLGIDTNTPHDYTEFQGNDVLYFDDHGLWDPDPSIGTRYIFNYTFDEIMGDQVEANSKIGRVYTLPDSPSIGNYGISVSSILDTNHDTFPISIDVSQNYESPEIKDGSNTRPPSSSITLTIMISDLIPSVDYILYSYTDITSVPTDSFNTHSSMAATQQTIRISSGSTFTLTANIQTSDQRIYRCVKASAP
jgi:hypothetical protein